MVVTAPGGPEITVAIRQGPMILNCCVCGACFAPVAIGMPRTLSVLAAVPDQVRQPADQNADDVGNGVKHVAGAVRQSKMLDQLAYRRVQSEYSECPPD